MAQIEILFLAANPDNQTLLNLGREYREVEAAIRSSEYRDRLHATHVPSAGPGDLQEELHRHEPHIVHFSGHGTASGELLFQNEAELSHPVDTAALRRLFALLRGNVRVVVLNACFSALQAEAIAHEIECVIGMSEPITDQAAIVFARNFYLAIGYGRSVEEAFELGKNQLQIEGLAHEADKPRLFVHREGVSASTVYLTSARAAAPTPPAMIEDRPHVDRRQELELFKAMLDGEHAAHMMFIAADSGMGKSALLRELARHCSSARRGKVDLKRGGLSPEAVLDTLADQLGGEHFVRFQQSRNDQPATGLAGLVGGVGVGGAGPPSRSAVGAMPSELDVRQQMLRKLTTSFVTELAELARQESVTLFFDSFDVAEGELAEWFQSVLLERLTSHRQVVVVVCGQVEPRLTWDEQVVVRKLRNLERADVQMLIERVGLQLSEEGIDVLWRSSMKGHPSLLATNVEHYLVASDD